MDAKEQELKEKRFYLTSQHYITISALVAIILWSIGATTGVIQKLEIAPLKQKVLQREQELANASLENKSLSTELEQIKQAYKTLLAESEIPALFVPSDAGTVIGKQVTFKWDYKHHRRYQKYILEIYRISDTKCETYRFNVLNPEQKLMYLPTDSLSSGEHLWRIVPGYLSNDQVVTQGIASNYRSFTLYRSIIDRIRQSRMVRVGTSPAFTGSFHFLHSQGDIRGFDIDLIRG